MSSDIPILSLVLTAYNAENTLPRMLDSVLIQGYADWELIVVDDGSSDDTLAVTREFAKRDSRIIVLAQPHAGCAAARARGAHKARGEFVAKIDADDELEADALQQLVKIIKGNPRFDIYSVTGTKVYSDGEEESFFRSPRFQKSCSLTLEDLLDDCFIFGGLATIRKSKLAQVGGFREDVYCEDYDLWLRALAQGAKHLYTPLSLYRYYVGSRGRMNEDPTKSLRSFVAIFQDLIEAKVLSEADTQHAKNSIRKFESQINQYKKVGQTEASITNDQARSFQRMTQHYFGDKSSKRVMVCAEKMKWIVKPVRIALAKREIRKKDKRR